MTFRRLRILLLLGVLAAAAGLTWLEQTLVRAWGAPLDVAVIPINGDGSSEAAETIAGLKAEDFGEIGAFLTRETARYGMRLRRWADFALGASLPAYQIPKIPLAF